MCEHILPAANRTIHVLNFFFLHFFSLFIFGALNSSHYLPVRNCNVCKLTLSKLWKKFLTPNRTLWTHMASTKFRCQVMLSASESMSLHRWKLCKISPIEWNGLHIVWYNSMCAYVVGCSFLRSLNGLNSSIPFSASFLAGWILYLGKQWKKQFYRIFVEINEENFHSTLNSIPFPSTFYVFSRFNVFSLTKIFMFNHRQSSCDWGMATKQKIHFICVQSAAIDRLMQHILLEINRTLHFIQIALLLYNFRLMCHVTNPYLMRYCFSINFFIRSFFSNLIWCSGNCLVVTKPCDEWNIFCFALNLKFLKIGTKTTTCGLMSTKLKCEETKQN